MVKKYFERHIIAVLSVLSILLAGGGFLWCYFGLRHLGPGPLILHFDQTNGITQVGDAGAIFWFGILGILIVLTNCGLAFAMARRSPFLGKFMAFAGLVLAVLLFLGFAAILGVN